MGPILSSSPHLVIYLSTLWCEAEITVQTFLIVIKVGRKNELGLFRLAEDGKAIGVHGL